MYQKVTTFGCWKLDIFVRIGNYTILRKMGEYTGSTNLPPNCSNDTMECSLIVPIFPMNDR